MTKTKFRKINTKKSKSKRKHLYKMKGGNYSENNVQELLHLGFTQEQIETLSQHIPNANIVIQSLQQINPNTNNLFTPQEIMNEVNNNLNENLNENYQENPLDISDIQSMGLDNHSLHLDNDDSFNLGNDDSFNLDNDDSFNLGEHNASISLDTTRENISNTNDDSIMNSLNLSNLSNGPLNNSDLETNNASINTTRDNSFGGKNTKRHRYVSKKSGTKNKKRILKSKNTNKKRKSLNKKNKTHKSRKSRGGSNIGSNCSDPNFSIYNTNMLKLFPYKS